MKKIRKRKIAALSAALVLFVTACPVFAGNVCAEEAVSGSVTDIDVSRLPEWVPNDFYSSLCFVKEHGSTFAEDNLVCIVRKREGSYNYKTDISSGYLSDVVFNETYSFEAPDESDFGNRVLYEEYIRYLEDNFGIDASAADEFLPDVSFEVIVIAPSSSGSFDVSLVSMYESGKEAARKDLSFEMSENGVRETDVFAWLPDCIKEYEKFVSENGVSSAHENYVVFCGTPCYDGGYSWKNSQNGTGRMKCVMDYSITEENIYPLAPGSAPLEMLVYTPTACGTVEMTWGEHRDWEPGSYIPLGECCYRLNKEGYIEKIDKSEMQYPVYGDCNDDGKATISDMIMLQKWFLGVGKLKSHVNADYNRDGKVNIFDLSEIKALITHK